MSRLRGCFCATLLFFVCSACWCRAVADDKVFLTETGLKEKIQVAIKEAPYAFENNLLYFMTTQHINDAYVAHSNYPEALYLYYANSLLHKCQEQHGYDLQHALESIQKAIAVDRGNGLLYFYRSFIESRLGQKQRAILDFEEGCKKKMITGYGKELTKGIATFLKNNGLYNSYNAIITYAYIEELSFDTSFLVYTSRQAVDLLHDRKVPRETKVHLYNNICDYLKAEEGSLNMFRLPLLVMARSIVQKAPPDIATRSCSIDLDPMIRASKETLLTLKTYESTRDMRVLDASPLWHDFTRVERYLSMQ